MGYANMLYIIVDELHVVGPLSTRQFAESLLPGLLAADSPRSIHICQRLAAEPPGVPVSGVPEEDWCHAVTDYPCEIAGEVVWFRLAEQ